MAKVISPHARSIGIITSPFPLKRANETDAEAAVTPAPTSNDIQVRDKDSSALLQYRCREVVTAFVDYLRVLHPQSRISIHNGRNETVMTSYVRLIMANQTIAGTSSTFGVFPTIASFGTGYLSSPPFDQSVPRTRWMLEEFANDQDSDEEAVEKGVVIVEDNARAKVSFIQQLWQMEGADGVVAWFQS
jgi:hypothetical protein